MVSHLSYQRLLCVLAAKRHFIGIVSDSTRFLFFCFCWCFFQSVGFDGSSEPFGESCRLFVLYCFCFVRLPLVFHVRAVPSSTGARLSCNNSLPWARLKRSSSKKKEKKRKMTKKNKRKVMLLLPQQQEWTLPVITAATDTTRCVQAPKSAHFYRNTLFVLFPFFLFSSSSSSLRIVSPCGFPLC